MEVSIPYELFFNILLKTKKINDALNLCATNTAIQAICNDDYFYLLRFKLDFPDLSTLKPPTDQTYKQLYQLISSTGIGKNLTIKVPEVMKDILFVYIYPPYTITEVALVGLTEVIGRHYYVLTPDSAIYKYGDRWNFIQFPRDADNDKRIDIFAKSTNWLNNIDEVQNIINYLLQNGYYVIKDTYISDKNFAKLKRNNLIGKINEYTRIDIWNKKVYL